MTPVKAIREYCINCSAFSLLEVRECEFADCPLYPYRMGKRPRANTTPIKAIRSHCKRCMDEQVAEVTLCPSKQCPIWEYRLGHRPAQDE